MKNFCFFLILQLIIVAGNSQNADIEALLKKVSGDTIFNKIEQLQQLDRVCHLDSVTESLTGAAYIHAELEKIAEIDSVYNHFHFDSLHSPNIIAIKQGTVFPDSIFVVGAHYDAVHPFAGADDNASGTAGLLEMLRTLECYSFEKTVYFIFFAAEEVITPTTWGLIGSRNFNSWANNQGLNIYGMINFDGISHKSTVSTEYVMIINDSEDSSSFALRDNIESIATEYVPNIFTLYRSNIPQQYQSFLGLSDHIAFQENGIPAVHLIELLGFEQMSVYHLPGDTINFTPEGSANSPVLAERIVRVALASTAENANIQKTHCLNTVIENGTLISDIDAHIYPNPNNGAFRIHIKGYSQKLLVSMYDVFGNSVFEGDILPPYELSNSTQMPPGVYFVSIKDKNQIQLSVTKVLVK